MKFSVPEKFIIALIIILAVIAGVSFYLKDIRNFFVGQKVIATDSNLISENNSVLKYVPPQKLSDPPKIVKAVYVTGYSAGSKKYLDYLSNLFKTTEINAVVVDIKDYSGLVSYKSGASDAKKYSLYNSAIKDIDSLVRFFHDQNIYVIGRIAVFEDPAFSKARPDLAVYNKIETTDLSKPTLWQDKNKLSWVDPASKDVWDYNISLAKDAFYHGFDEINFDYSRFPTDGNKDTRGFPIWDGKVTMADTIKSFFQYLRTNLSGEKISIDLFGQTTINKDDMGIGQLIEDAFENFDYVSPMVYPSHYINGFIGFSNPAEHPYDIVKYSMGNALIREIAFLKQKQALVTTNNKTPETPVTASGAPEAISQSIEPTLDMALVAKFRPWLQDFNMGAKYTADMVKAEIKATQDALGADYNGFMLWNPSNVYSQGAIIKPN